MEEKTNAQIKEELVSLGMPEDEVSKLPSIAKSTLIALINTLKAKEVVQKVDTLTPPVNPVEDREIASQHRSKSEIMRAIIMGQIDAGEISNVLIPISGKEKKGVINWVLNPKTNRNEQVHVSGAIQPFTLNGFQYLVPKGISVNVPKRIAEELELKFNQTAEAG